MSNVADVCGKEHWKTQLVVQVFEVQTWQKLDVSSVASLSLKSICLTVGKLISACLFCW